ncbi:MAG TPA: maleylpyruvate isomerase N-terminal domain-containing protein, partial [Robiginitalea sp.]|nr:maleylpyruvate isomerase N-terminal domain-containing protein [Robiginitalea sp.]
MNSPELEALRYPMGRFTAPESIDQLQVGQWIDALETLPGKVRSLVATWSDARLDTPYRPAGWTVRQVVHHLSDSHHNSYVRFKWALTED